MALSINWPTAIITIPKSFMTLIGTDLYELDLDVFRAGLNDLQDDEAGINWPTTHQHTPPHTLGGTVFAREVFILSPYRVVFEDDQYGVNVTGGNTNILDAAVIIRNQVSVATANSGGLVVGGSADQATVQAALTAQGYTTARAPNLDNLDVAVSTRGAEATLLQIYQLLGLDPTKPLVVTATTRRVPSDGSVIDQTIADVAGTVTVTRQ